MQVPAQPDPSVTVMFNNEEEKYLSLYFHKSWINQDEDAVNAEVLLIILLITHKMTPSNHTWSAAYLSPDTAFPH